MKIQIDTEKKVLRLESDVNLEEFMSKIKTLFPNGEWKEYKLETNVEIHWTNPIYIDRWHYPTYPWWPTWNPTIYETPVITCEGGPYGINGGWSVNPEITTMLCSADKGSGIYNVEA